MTGRLTNLALAAVMVLALVTGILSFATGTSAARWPVFAHGAIGLAVLVLAPWKTVIARRGLRRSRPGHVTGLLLGLLIVVTVVSGLLFSTGVVLRYGPLNAMQVHVGSALVAIPLAARHIVIRPTRLRSVDNGRRTLLRLGGVAAGAVVAWVGIESVGRLLRLPGADRRFTGSHERASHDPPAMPATQWLNDTAPDLEPGAWRLSLASEQGRSTLGLSDLDPGTDSVTAILDCTSGWWSEQSWSGVRLDRLLGDAPGRSIVVRSATGYARRFPRSDATRLMVATHLGGQPLSRRHGAPARLVAPGRRGFWWVKWVTEIEVDDRPWWLQSPFPLT